MSSLVNWIFPKSSVSDRIEEAIYYPPNTSPEQFETLKKGAGYHEFLENIKTKYGQVVPAIIFYPKHYVPPEYKNPCACIFIHPHQQLKNANNRYLIFAHGNGCDIYTFARYGKLLADTLNVNVVLFDYVGYGLSREVKPSEQGCYDSLEAIVNHISTSKEYNNILALSEETNRPAKIYLVGQSLGTGVVIDYASKSGQTTPIMVISPYLSIGNVGTDLCVDSTTSSSSSSTSSIGDCLSSSLTKMTRLVGLDKFVSEEKMKKLKCSVQIIHGQEDKLIKVLHAKKLYDQLPTECKKFEPILIEDADHNNILHKLTPKMFTNVFGFDIEM